MDNVQSSSKIFKSSKYLVDEQFGFQTGHSKDHAIAQLVDQIYETFEKNEYTLGLFIDLSKAFDTVDHSILLRKLEVNYLQHIQLDEKYKTGYCLVKCRVPQSSVLGSLQFLLYVSYLNNASSALDSIMFADDTNLFYTHSNMQRLFSTVNEELASNNQWFTSNKVSLNAKKKKFPTNPVKNIIYLLYYQRLLSVIVLLKGKNLLNFSEYY